MQHSTARAWLADVAGRFWRAAADPTGEVPLAVLLALLPGALAARCALAWRINAPAAVLLPSDATPFCVPGGVGSASSAFLTSSLRTSSAAVLSACVLPINFSHRLMALTMPSPCWLPDACSLEVSAACMRCHVITPAAYVTYAVCISITWNRRGDAYAAVHEAQAFLHLPCGMHGIAAGAAVFRRKPYLELLGGLFHLRCFCLLAHRACCCGGHLGEALAALGVFTRPSHCTLSVYHLL